MESIDHREYSNTLISVFSAHGMTMTVSCTSHIRGATLDENIDFCSLGCAVKIHTSLQGKDPNSMI
jgi:hypothetical protein